MAGESVCRATRFSLNTNAALTTTETTIVAAPIHSELIPRGVISLWIASQIKNSPEKPMTIDWNSPARDSALPCPYEWSSSAGREDARTAMKFRIEAKISIAESSSEASTLTEPVIQPAPAFSRIRNAAQIIDRRAAECLALESL